MLKPQARRRKRSLIWTEAEATEEVAKVYSAIIKAGIYKATSIKVAEAAKVIENTQRDLNIALVNELSIIFERIGIDNIARYEHDLLVYATAAMLKVPGLHFVGTAKEKASVLSFNLDGFKSEEVGAALNQEGIAVRSGHHCAQPILRRFGVETTVRPSLAFYNTPAEVDVMVNALMRLTSSKAPGGL